MTSCLHNKRCEKSSRSATQHGQQWIWHCGAYSHWLTMGQHRSCRRLDRLTTLIKIKVIPTYQQITRRACINSVSLNNLYPISEWVILIIIIAMTMFIVQSSWPKVIARVHAVHLMNAVWAPDGRQPSDQANWRGLWVRRNWQLSSTSTIAIIIVTQPVSWYSFYRPTEGGRLSRPGHCSKDAQPVPKAVYFSGVRSVIRTLVLSHRSQTR